MRWIINWLRRIFTSPPRAAKNLRLEGDMNNLTVSWKLPTSRTGGGQIAPADLDDTIVEMSADGGANYSPLNPVPPTEPQQAFIPDLPFGTYHFRIIVVDLLGQRAAPLEGSYSLEDTSAPGPATDLQFALS